MDRLRALWQCLSPERLAWFGAGLAAASLALVSYQVAFGALLSPTPPPGGELTTPIALSPTRTPWPTDTPRPTRTPWPTHTPRPTRTPWPTDTPRATRTPRDTATAWPTRTPRDTPAPWPTRTPRDTPAPWPTRTSAPPQQAFSTDVATFAERLTGLAAAMATASARLACRSPTPSGAPVPCV